MSVRGQRGASAGGRELKLFESARELATKQERAWTRIHSSINSAGDRTHHKFNLIS